jgi:ketosteroid isomerase-like protein
VSQENVEVVRGSIEGWNRGEFDAWARPRGIPPANVEFVSDISKSLEETDRIWQGLAGPREFWNETRSLWGSRIDISEIRDLGETVLVLGSLYTRGQASGVALDTPIAFVYEFGKGSIRKVRLYLDPSEALKAVGLEE